MSDEVEGLEGATGIYVLPSEENMPARAIIGPAAVWEQVGAPVGLMATWSADTGCWQVEGDSIPPELGAAITERCRELEVPGFFDS